MKREIKFRGKPIDKNIDGFVYGSLLRGFFYDRRTSEEVIYIASPDIYPDYDSFDDMESMVIRVHPASVGQYTGLKDKNGKKIYEGDIIEMKHPFRNRHYIGEIVFKNGSFIAKGFFMTHFDNPSDFREGLDYTVIIGNTYENPELLESDSNEKRRLEEIDKNVLKQVFDRLIVPKTKVALDYQDYKILNWRF